MKSPRNIQTVILVAGRGTRLQPYTDTVPKPLVLVGGKPFLAHLLAFLRQQGLRRFLLVAAYKADQVVHFAKTQSLQESPVEVVVAPEDLGTGGHLKYAEPQVDEEFFLVYGDTLFPVSYAELYRDFAASGQDAVMSVTGKIPQGATGNVALSHDKKIVVVYKKGDPQSSLTHLDAGVLCMRRGCLQHLPPRGTISHMEEQVFPVLAQKRTLGAHLADLECFDIGTPERLKYYEDHFFGS